jgi:phenylacetate-CoA ligase
MSSFINRIYSISPDLFQNFLISMFDLLSYRIRRKKTYKNWKKYYKQKQYSSLFGLQKIQNDKLTEFINFANDNSKYYKYLYKDIDLSAIKGVRDLKMLPVIDKEEIRTNINDIVTLSKKKAYIANTGGTTGKSLEILFSQEDIQERWAILDAFREEFGYKLGLRTAWFSGKTILSKKDERINRFWKTDYIYKIRYYSTFHINQNTIKYYINNLNQYKPIIISGFPSNIFSIANFSITQDYPINFQSKAIFVTAETIIPYQIEMIRKAFKCKVYNQYASSEGAPFITQCPEGKLHYQLLSGVIEIVDKDMCPSDKGEILVTSFTTHGTPLIRYRIGDEMKLSNEKCKCGQLNPIIEKIYGRVNDYIYSTERGEINLGNISNCVKYVSGIINFQIIQKTFNLINVLIVRDVKVYSKKDEVTFLRELRERLGEKIEIVFNYVDEIGKSKSGKFQIVKNEINNFLKSETNAKN